MPRPKGSKNKRKRKYTRRKHLMLDNGAAMTGEALTAAKDLQLKVRGIVMVAPPNVRRVAIADLIADLQWMAQVQEDNPPAP